MLTSALLLALAQAPASPPSAVPLDLTAEARLLYRVVACGNDDPLPPGFDAKVVAAHCKEMQRRYAKYRATWIAEAEPFIQALKPPGLPRVVVYPFGGGDLISALTTYPEATEYTTMSLEHAGDPRRIQGLSSKQLEDSLWLLRATSSGLLVANDSKTENLMKVQRGELPGQLCFFLMGLAVHGYDVVRLRYVTLEPDGAVRALTAEDVAALEKKEAKLLHQSWVSPDFSAAFDNLELVFVKRGEDPATQARVHRHFAQNLDDRHFGQDAAMQAYLRARKPISAMTKAASYLLWRDDFKAIRGYLLEHMEFMVSDSTGIPPRYATRAGFVQDAYGRFAGSFLPASQGINDEFRALWKAPRKLGFRYGYLDQDLSMHMLITRRPAADAGVP